MQNELIEKMAASRQTVYGALQAFGEINKKMLRDSADLQLSYTSYCFDKSLEWAQLAGETTNYMDFLSKETEFASQYSTKMMELSNKAVNIITGSRDEVIAWFEKSAVPAEKETKSATKGPTRK